MLNIFRSRREESGESQVLLLFGTLITVGGGFPTALGIVALVSRQEVSDSFWTAMTISGATLACGIGALAYRWRLGRKERYGKSADGGNSP